MFIDTHNNHLVTEQGSGQDYVHESIDQKTSLMDRVCLVSRYAHSGEISLKYASDGFETIG